MSVLASRQPYQAHAVMARHGKSFNWAARFLGRRQAHAAARLYAFCRLVDDVADSCEPDRAAALLAAIDRDLVQGHSAYPVVADFLELTESHGIDLEIARELIAGLRQDLATVRIRDEGALIRYCYRVAGTVGLMMCDILGARSPAARLYAIDLGIAMQLTNIARDVLEDAQNGRRYLPASSLGEVSPDELCRPGEPLRERASAAVLDILDLADAYYQSGQRGLAYLPPRSRLAVAMAARLYHGIGDVIRSRGGAYWRGRAVVSTLDKLRYSAAAFADSVSPRHLPQRSRDSRRLVRAHLAGLPGTNGDREAIADAARL